MLKTRKILTNGKGITDIAGNPLSGVIISFQIVDYDTGEPTNTQDINTGETILSKIYSVKTDANGDFSINLWANDRGLTQTKYEITIDYMGFAPFYSYLTDGTTDLLFSDFIKFGVPATPEQIDTIQKYLDNFSLANGDMTRAIYDADNDGIVDHAKTADAIAWANVSNKPLLYPPENHAHLATDITTDASNQFVSATEKTAWNAKLDAFAYTPENVANKNVANGYAGLDEYGLIPTAQLPPNEILSVNGQTGVINLTYGDVGACAATDVKLYDARTPKYHTHTIADIADLDLNAYATQTSLTQGLSAKSDLNHTHNFIKNFNFMLINPPANFVTPCVYLSNGGVLNNLKVSVTDTTGAEIAPTATTITIYKNGVAAHTIDITDATTTAELNVAVAANDKIAIGNSVLNNLNLSICISEVG